MKPMSEIISADANGIQRAACVIQKGGVVAFPTESCYGLAADALDPNAVAKVVAIKGRKESKNISVLIADLKMLGKVVSYWSKEAQLLMDKYWPGPLTLVLQARSELSTPLVNSDGGIGVRISSDNVALQLVSLVGRPITATSANLSGKKSAVIAKEARLDGVDLVLDGGRRDGELSTVLEIIGNPRVLRQGAIKL